GPVKKLQYEKVGVELNERGHRRVPKIAIGLTRHTREVGVPDSISDEGTDHLDRDLRIRFPGKALHRCATESRPMVWHVETPVAGKAREHHIDKIERGGLTPGGDVTH